MCHVLPAIRYMDAVGCSGRGGTVPSIELVCVTEWHSIQNQKVGFLLYSGCQSTWSATCLKQRSILGENQHLSPFGARVLRVKAQRPWP